MNKQGKKELRALSKLQNADSDFQIIVNPKIQSGDPCCNDGQIGILTGLSSKSGSFSQWLSRARSAGFITGTRSNLQITQEGINALGEFNELPTGNDLYIYWQKELGSGGERKIFDTIHDANPNSISDESIGEVTGLSFTSGSFSQWISRLRSRKLISGNRKELRMSEELFD